MHHLGPVPGVLAKAAGSGRALSERGGQIFCRLQLANKGLLVAECD